jgi:ribosome-binding protein aMBF1 (putative translation factor)
MGEEMNDSLGRKFDDLRARYVQTPEEIEEYERTVRTIATIRRFLMAIDEERRRLGISKAKLARRIGADPSVVRRLFTSEDSNPTLRTVVEMLSALDIDVQLTPAERPSSPTTNKRSRRGTAREKVA